MQNSDFWTRITSLYGSQTWPVVLFMYNSVLSIRNTSLYLSNTSSVVFARKTAWLASELLVSMGPSPHVCILDGNGAFWIGITSLYVSQVSPVVLGTHYSVISTRYTCLYGSQSFIFGFSTQNIAFWSRITSLYGYQNSPAILWMQKSVISLRITSLNGSQPSSVVFGSKTATFGPE